jgi:hypothetical protein
VNLVIFDAVVAAAVVVVAVVALLPQPLLMNMN